MKPEEANALIAGYMNLANMDDYFITHKGRLHLNELEYHDKIEWIYPVYIKIRRELTEMFDKNEDSSSFWPHFRREAIERALIQGDIPELHSEIVKGIQFITENKK